MSKYEPAARPYKDLICPMTKFTAMLESCRFYGNSHTRVFFTGVGVEQKARNIITSLHTL